MGEFLLLLLVLTVAIAWALRQSMRRHSSWRWSGAELLLLATVALLVVQIVPLPPAILASLSPKISTLLPLWSEEQAATFQLETWRHVSLTPAATRAGLILFLAYSLLFLITIQRIRAVDDVERLLRWIAFAAVLMAIFGLVQFFASNGKFFWFYEHPYSKTNDIVKGGFTNRNHFAHFLALGVGPLVWWIQHAWRQQRKHSGCQFAQHSHEISSFRITEGFRILAFSIVMFAVLLSLSRGGALVTLLATVIALAVCYRAGTLRLRLVAGLTGVVLLIGLCLAIYGQDQVTSRLDDFTNASLSVLDRDEARRTIWETTSKAIPHFWLLGSGVGSFRDVYPMFLPWQSNSKFYSHAENGYLQVALETGFAGLALLLIGIALCGFWCLGSLRTSHSKRHLVCAGAVGASLAVSMVHSLFDFVWYIPGCMTAVVILAACACRLRQLAIEESRPRVPRSTLPRLAGAMISVLILGLGVWMLSQRSGRVWAEPGWNHYLIMQRTPLESILTNPDAEHPPTDEERDDTILAIEQKTIHELEQVTRWDPDHADAHLALAGAYLRLFERLQARSSLNTMPLGEISAAALQSQFPSREALNEWLVRAVGRHAQLLDLAYWHARKGLTLCPLAGEGYLYLGDLCFLNGVPASVKSAYLAQAQKVRPFDGSVLFYAGKEAARRGDLEQTLALWRRSYDCGRPYQSQLIKFLAGRTHPDHLDAEIQVILQTFEPDFHGLQLILNTYRPIAQPEQLTVLHYARAQAAAKEAAQAEPKQAASLWLAAMQSYAAVGDMPRQLECGRAALRADSNQLAIRQALALCLADAHQYAEAEEHLRWCLRRKPNSRHLEAKLRDVLQNRIRSEGQTATRPMMEASQR